MRLPRVRVTVRGMMVAVAVVGAALGGLAGLDRRRARLERLGSDHRARVVCVLAGSPGPDGVYAYEPRGFDQRGRPTSRRQRAADRWHEAMAQKYRRAARYPWLPVAPD